MQQGLKTQSSSTTDAAADTSVPGAGPGAENAPAGPPHVPQDAVSDAWSNDHAVNIRITIPLPFVRCYLAIVGGKERRNPKRRAEERRKNPLGTRWNIAFLTILGVITGAALYTVIQYAARFVLDTIGAV